MNKAELIEALAERFGGNRAEAGRALNAVVETIMRETARQGKVSITGFGVFETVHRPERMVRNPRTGERKAAEATDVPRFRPGTELKALVADASGEARTAPAAKAPAAKAPAKSTASKSTAAKTTAAKAPAKSAAPKSTASKSTAPESTASKGTARKTSPRRTSAS